MAIKDLFRKRSKSRVRSNSRSDELSRSTTPTPGAMLNNSPGNSPQTHNRASSGAFQSYPQRDSSMQNAGSRVPLDQTAQPYQEQSAGRPPSIGATPLAGNATNDNDRSRARSIGGGRSMDMNRPSQAAPSSMTTSTTSGIPSSVTTTTTTTTSTGSRTGHKHGASRSQDAGGHRYTSSEVPPQIPATDFSNRQIGEQSQQSGTLPIASEFSSSTWSQQQQRGQPPMQQHPAHSSQVDDYLDERFNDNDDLARPNQTQSRLTTPYSEPFADMSSQNGMNGGTSAVQQERLGHKRSMSIPRKSISSGAAPVMPSQKMPTREKAHQSSVQQQKQAPSFSQQTQQPSFQQQTQQLQQQQQNDWKSQIPASATVPTSTSTTAGNYTHPKLGEIRQGRQQIYSRPYLVEGASSPPSLEGIVDLRNTVDTTTHITYAPAVIHEVVHTTVHNIRREEVTRDIHNYHILPRHQPVIDVQVLPPKHLVQTAPGTYNEIPASQFPGNSASHFVIAETVSKIAHLGQAPHPGPRTIDARELGPGVGADDREYVNSQGVPTTEQTWIYPPRHAAALRDAGKTAAFPMDDMAERAMYEQPGRVDKQGHVVVGGGRTNASTR